LEWEFRIGQALPATDAVARFVTGLAMANNEWHRTMTLMPMTDPTEATPEERGLRIMLARQQAALCYEGITFVKAARRSSHVVTFMNDLNTGAKKHYADLSEATDKKSPFYLPWLRGHRNVTLHVPAVTPSKGERGVTLTEALTEAAGRLGRVSHDGTFRTVRFGFADVVAEEFLPWEEERDLMKHLSRALLALGGFAHEALDAYLEGLPLGVVQRIAEGEPAHR
jgi:hypothetical protein